MPAVYPVLRTRLIPPTATARTLPRARVTAQLSQSLQYSLTVLQAGAGYGKSTALAALARDQRPVIWYQVSKDDNDLIVFLLHLCHASKLAFPDLEGLPIPLLESWDPTLDPLPTREVVYQYLNAVSEVVTDRQTLLIIDDAHLVIENVEIAQILDQVIGLAPPGFHVLLSSRGRIDLPSMQHWKLLGKVLFLDQTVLAFTDREISTLFEQHFSYALTDEEVAALCQATEGWAITLQLIWQALRAGIITSIQDDLPRQDKPLESLFEMLAEDVLAQQPEDVQEFMRITSVLRELSPEACNAVMQTGDSQQIIEYLRREELFFVEVENPDDGSRYMRYHFIFHRFLRRQLSDGERIRRHGIASGYFFDAGDYASSIYHLLKAEDFKEAARQLELFSSQLIEAGRLDSLAGYLEVLPPAVLSQHPGLIFHMGDLARLRSRFQEALAWYREAESLWRDKGQVDGISRALRGQARVYLDTVNPSRAEELIQQSLHLSDGTADREAHARVLELLAENKLNAGKPNLAEELQKAARDLLLDGPSDKQLLYRVLLRTGRLSEALSKLEAQSEVERKAPVQTSRAHRETMLLLSILHAFMGEAEKSYRSAVEGTERGRALNSPYVTAVGHMRRGHALMLTTGPENFDEAQESFEHTVEMSRTLAIPRLCVEAYWGLCRAHGYRGDLSRALDAAEKGIEFAAQFGDEWLISLIRLAMGNSYLFTSRFEAAEIWLNQARRGFVECSDSFGSAVSQLMLALGYHLQNDETRLAQLLPAVMRDCRRLGYGFLFTRPTLLAVPDERMLVPLLVTSRNRGWESRYTQDLLEQIGLPRIAVHPGYRLEVVTLGSFQVLRGREAISTGTWLRATARQLWQLLLSYDDSPLDREQIFEHLWPGQEQEIAQRNFKVALNTLYKVLEPDRPPGRESSFILREGSVYALRPGADIRLDFREFFEALAAADQVPGSEPDQAIAGYESALALYGGEFIPEARYEHWAIGRREHLAVQFLKAADRLCELYLNVGRLGAAVSLAQRILDEDPCWERAYQHQIQAFIRLGDHGQAARAYQRCVAALRSELDVAPSEETDRLYRDLIERD